MATKALITPEQYLSTPFEREPEFVHGYIYDRGLVHVHQLELPRLNFTLTPDQLFA
jgi:hypothetical protein